MFGLPVDTHRACKRKEQLARYAPYNGFIAFWDLNKAIQFPPIFYEELALLRFVVLDEGHNIIAQRTLPLKSLNPGYRHIGLRDKCNHPIPLAQLFVRICLNDYVAPELEAYVQMLANPDSSKRKSK